MEDTDKDLFLPYLIKDDKNILITLLTCKYMLYIHIRHNSYDYQIKILFTSQYL